ncbi:hypothetical protein [Nostoc sp. JL23]|uniref:hypothetical protein n=1 Tax=Nostoc sp. JL23 TaxID=2815394 RepID=UPI001E13AAEE|nr:hypothetical protein [Nostoc sp. JL23]MBN3875272.1 hypothetical protein [Nostoc sp. JL23]
MKEKPDLRIINQEAGRNAAQLAEQMSDEELRQAILKALQSQGYPGDDLPPGIDTTRVGLLDLIAGMVAIGQSAPVD